MIGRGKKPFMSDFTPHEGLMNWTKVGPEEVDRKNFLGASCQFVNNSTGMRDRSHWLWWGGNADAAQWCVVTVETMYRQTTLNATKSSKTFHSHHTSVENLHIGFIEAIWVHFWMLDPKILIGPLKD